MSNPTVKELLFRLEDRNIKELCAISTKIDNVTKEFTIFKWKTIGIATGGATVLSSLIMLISKVVF